MKQLITTRRQFLVTATAIGAAGAVPGLARRAFAQESALNVRFDLDPDILDPGYMSGGVEIETQKQCLPILAEYVTRDDNTFFWRPSLYAKKLEQRDDMHVDFELQDFLEWSGGHGPVLASDVKYSFERMKGTDWSGYFDALDHVEVTGDRTGTIVLTEPFAPFIMVTLCHGPGIILSEKAMKEVGERFTTEFPATCGPYSYEHTPGQRATFTLDQNWKGPKPEFERVVAHIIGEAKSSELAYEAGELACTEVSSDTLARYTKEPPADSKLTIGGELQYMWLGMNTENPKLRDKKVRRAIQHAVDVDSIIQGAYSGTTEKSFGIICPGLTGKRFETKYYSYDPEKARALLDEAGVTDLKLTLRTLNLQERLLAAQIIQANLAQVGVNVEILPLDGGPFWEMGVEEKGDTWKELEIWLMRFGTVPDPYEATQWFVSDQVGIWNWERWTDPEYDRLYKEGLGESDPAKRNDIYIKMQEIMEETGAYVWINHEPEAFVHRSDLLIKAAPTGDLNYQLFKRL